MIEISIDTKFIEKLLEYWASYIQRKYGLRNLHLIPPEIKATADPGLGRFGMVPVKVTPKSHGDELWLNLTMSAGLLAPTASRLAAERISKATGFPNHGGTLKIPLRKYGIVGFNLLFTEEHLHLRVRLYTEGEQINEILEDIIMAPEVNVKISDLPKEILEDSREKTQVELERRSDRPADQELVELPRKPGRKAVEKG